MSTTKNILNLSLVGFSISVLAASTIGFFYSPSAVQAQKSQRPTVARVTQLSNGDLACYITLVDSKGKKHNSIVGGFDFCAKPKTYLNKRVRLTYGQMRINDCQSAEPCGKTRVVTGIRKMQVIK
ncbi:MAG: hypothetical protein IGS39_08795 [Calothrix sp. C42_A2020_038]|nr:hypothetical protein [Calothrix sp. C42_A2020_038]